MTQDIRYMIERFPAYKDKIITAYQTDEEFRILCEDFYSSALILKSSIIKVIEDQKSDLEYRKLFLDLETEILKFLSAHDPH